MNASLQSRTCRPVQGRAAGAYAWRWEGREPQPLPATLRTALRPSECAFHEWQDYWLDAPGADRLRVGSEWLTPALRSLFRVRFENRLGATALQPFREGVALCPPLYAEVVSSKLGSLSRYASVLHALLEELCADASELALAPSAPTAVALAPVASSAMPSPLVVFQWLTHRGEALRAAMAMVRAAPHRAVGEGAELVPLGAAAELDADALNDLAGAPCDWGFAPAGTRRAVSLGGRWPARVRQRRAQETYDTPENRFARALVLQTLAALESVRHAPFFSDLAPERRHDLESLAAEARSFLRQPVFAALGPMSRIPSASQVLMRREGYREMLALWQELHASPRPLLGALGRAADLRDAAQLYEIWCFFALARAAARALGEPLEYSLDVPAQGGLAYGAEARLGTRGTLVYNAAAASYSGTLRPDFAWVVRGRIEAVLDAKFRLARSDLESAPAVAESSDLAKMHAYRDALGVRAALCVYPGDLSVFYRRGGERIQGEALALGDVFCGRLDGIGALALVPGTVAAQGTSP